MRLGLVVALPQEARALTRVMAGARREEKPGRASPCPLHLLTGALAGQTVVMAWAGAGAGCAARAAGALLQRGADALLAVGFAGALSPALRPGDLLAATEVIDLEGGRWPADAEWLAALGDGAGVNDRCRVPACGCEAAASITITIKIKIESRRTLPAPNRNRNRNLNRDRATIHRPLHLGKLVTAPRVVAAASEKRRLGEQTGALAVDMESAAVAQCAAAAGVPMVALRAITDSADENLPLDFELCFDPDGQFHPTRLIGLLARRPLAVGGFMRLGRHSARAGQALASFLAWYLPRVHQR